MDNPKKKKLDRKLVAKSQAHEIRTLLKKWAITKEELMAIIDLAGRSRKTVEEELVKHGYKLREKVDKPAIDETFPQ
jgi:hypothetical protein